MNRSPARALQIQPFNLSQLAELALRRFEGEVLQHMARCFLNVIANTTS